MGFPWTTPHIQRELYIRWMEGLFSKEIGPTEPEMDMGSTITQMAQGTKAIGPQIRKTAKESIMEAKEKDMMDSGSRTGEKGTEDYNFSMGQS